MIVVFCFVFETFVHVPIQVHLLECLGKQDATSSDMSTDDMCYSERYHNMILVCVCRSRSSTMHHRLQPNVSTNLMTIRNV